MIIFCKSDSYLLIDDNDLIIALQMYQGVGYTPYPPPMCMCNHVLSFAILHSIDYNYFTTIFIAHR